MLPFSLGGQILFDEREIYLKNARKEINKESLLAPRQINFPHLVYGIVAQTAEHQGDVEKYTGKDDGQSGLDNGVP